jgi:hypothetical protein
VEILGVDRNGIEQRGVGEPSEEKYTTFRSENEGKWRDFRLEVEPI